MKVTTIGVDLAKSVFQVHGIDDRGHVVVRKQLRRDEVAVFFANLPACLVGMEACGGGDLRSSGQAEHALCTDQGGGATGGAVGAPGTPRIREGTNGAG